MNEDLFFICDKPTSPAWQLGPLREPIFLIGWSTEERSTDCGVPEKVATIIANALTDLFRVTFLSSESDALPDSDQWQRLGNDFFRRIKPSGFSLQWLGNRLPSQSQFVATGSPSKLIRAFDDGLFPWWMQGQILLLSTQTEDLPPDITFGHISGLSGDDWWTAATNIGSTLGIVRPGVDGDLAGIALFDCTLCNRLIDQLERRASEAGFQFAKVSEPEFQDRLAQS